MTNTTNPPTLTIEITEAQRILLLKVLDKARRDYRVAAEEGRGADGPQENFETADALDDVTYVFLPPVIRVERADLRVLLGIVTSEDRAKVPGLANAYDRLDRATDRRA